jgi:hypothetical protein
MRQRRLLVFCSTTAVAGLAAVAGAQLVDQTLAPNNAREGIVKSLAQEIGAGRGNTTTPNSSAFIIARDSFRAVRRGRQLFQRKFTRSQGQGPLFRDGRGNIHVDLIIGAGLADSCAACHGRPRGSAGFGGDVVTRPDSRDAPHLFGLGLKEMLGDEITFELRRIRDAALAEARSKGTNVTKYLFVRQGMQYGYLIARPNGSLDLSRLEGVDSDLRVRPFFLHGGTISIREFLVGAWNAEMGLQSVDSDLDRASRLRQRVVTPAGMVLDGSKDVIEAPPTADPNADPDGDGIRNEIPQSLVDFMEFYLLNYFKPGLGEQNSRTSAGRAKMEAIGCTRCHMPQIIIERDRRVADVETRFDTARGNFNRLFSTASPLIQSVNDGTGHPPLMQPMRGAFAVENIFTDFKRHDLGPNFHEINYDGTIRKQFLTTALWGVGSTGPYGHDGRSMSLTEVILRHGGAAITERNAFAGLPSSDKDAILAFLNSLILFPPDDTASNLDPGNRSTPGFPQFGHGSIRLTGLFLNPNDVE